MEQSQISGVGNIYKSESLFLAGIAPHRLMGSLDGEELKNFILQCVKYYQHRMSLVEQLFVTILIYIIIMGSTLGFHLILMKMIEATISCDGL